MKFTVHATEPLPEIVLLLMNLNPQHVHPGLRFLAAALGIFLLVIAGFMLGGHTPFWTLTLPTICSAFVLLDIARRGR